MSAPGRKCPPVRGLGAPGTVASTSSTEKPNLAPWDRGQGGHCGLQGLGRAGTSPWLRSPEAWVLLEGPRNAPAWFPYRLPRVTWPQFWSHVVRRNAMNVFCSSHTMKSFPLLVPLAEAGRPPSENSLDSNPRPPLALLAGGGGRLLVSRKPTRRIRPASGEQSPERQRLTLWEVEKAINISPLTEQRSTHAPFPLNPPSWAQTPHPKKCPGAGKPA